MAEGIVWDSAVAILRFTDGEVIEMTNDSTVYGPVRCRECEAGFHELCHQLTTSGCCCLRGRVLMIVNTGTTLRIRW